MCSFERIVVRLRTLSTINRKRIHLLFIEAEPYSREAPSPPEKKFFFSGLLALAVKLPAASRGAS